MKNECVGYKVPFYIRKNRYIEDNCDFLCAYIKANFRAILSNPRKYFFSAFSTLQLSKNQIFMQKNLHMCEKSSTFAYDFKRGCTSGGVGWYLKN